MIEHLHIENLGPIGDADIHFGDLTFFVGPQASGKSLALETLKLVIDRDSIIEMLDKYGYIFGHNTDRILNMYYGNGLAGLWSPSTEVSLDGIPFKRTDIPKNVQEGRAEESIFYIPAQRVLSVADGPGKPFMSYNSDTPYVNRAFGETVRQFIQYGIGRQTVLFPMNSRLKSHIRSRIDKSIFHGASIVLEEVDMQRKMVMKVEDMKIPIMSWSAGQKEFMPLLLGIYCLSGPPSKVLRRDPYKYVVIEEPEMGLHPNAIIDVILQIIEFIQTGYQVIVSTHSSVFLEFAWAFNNLKKMTNVTAKYNALYELFHVREIPRMKEMLAGVFSKDIHTYYFGKTGQREKSTARDITALDVWSDDPIMEEWGGLSSFASRATDIVSQYTADSILSNE